MEVLNEQAKRELEQITADCTDPKLKALVVAAYTRGFEQGRHYGMDVAAKMQSLVSLMVKP